MKYFLMPLLLCCAFLSGSFNAVAQGLVLKSSDITHGEFMSDKHLYNGFGCRGENISPQLSWTGVPKEAQALALLVHDPDAPTGSGWWHWQLVNIPANVDSLAVGAKKENLPAGAITMTNDYGEKAFGGACPPVGHGIHRYRFSLYALPKPLELPANASAALVGYMVKANAIAEANIVALYERKEAAAK